MYEKASFAKRCTKFPPIDEKGKENNPVVKN